MSNLMENNLISRTHLTNVASFNNKLEDTKQGEQANKTQQQNFYQKIYRFMEVCQNELQQEMEQHTLIIQNEPLLDVNDNLSGTKYCVYPLFADKFKQSFIALYSHIQNCISDYFDNTNRQKDSQFGVNFKSLETQLGYVTEEAHQYQEQIQFLEAALQDLHGSKHSQITILKQINLMLRQQFLVKNKIGSLYKPDFLKTSNDDAAIYTQKQMDIAVADQQSQFNEERREYERQIKKQAEKQQAALDELNDHIEQLKKLIAQLNKHVIQLTDEQNAIKLQYELKMKEENEFFEKQYQIQSKQNQTQLQSLMSEIDELHKQIQQQQKLYSTLEHDYQKLKEAINQLNVKYQSLQQENESLRNQRSLLNSQLKSSQNLQSNQDLLAEPKDELNMNDYNELLHNYNELQEKYKLLEMQQGAISFDKNLMENQIKDIQNEQQQDTQNLENYNQTEMGKLLFQAQQEFDQLQKLTSFLLQQLFSLSQTSGSFKRLLLQFNSQSPVNLYQELKLNLNNVDMYKYFLKYYKDEFDLISKFVTQLNEQLTTKTTDLPEKQQAQIYVEGISILSEVNSVLIADDQSSTARTHNDNNPTMCDMGVNTSICGTVENDYTVDKFVINQQMDYNIKQLQKFQNVEFSQQIQSNNYRVKKPTNDKVCAQCSVCKQLSDVRNVSLIGSNLHHNQNLLLDCDTCNSRQFSQIICQCCNEPQSIQQFLLNSFQNQPGVKQSIFLDCTKCNTTSKNSNNFDSQNLFIYSQKSHPVQILRSQLKQNIKIPLMERLLQKAREIESRRRRKRDLILQERQRTCERVLKGLGAFVETRQEKNVSQFQVQQCEKQRYVGNRVYAKSNYQSGIYVPPKSFLQEIMESAGKEAVNKIQSKNVKQSQYSQNLLNNGDRNSTNQQQNSVCQIIENSQINLKKELK